MKEDNHIFQRIEDYLNGTLSDAEKTIFEKELAENAALKKQVDLSTITNQLVFENRLLNIKELAQAAHQNENSKGNTGKFALISATAILLSVGAYVGLNKPESKQEVVPISENISKVSLSTTEPNNTNIELPNPISTENKKAEDTNTVESYCTKTTNIWAYGNDGMSCVFFFTIFIILYSFHSVSFTKSFRSHTS